MIQTIFINWDQLIPSILSAIQLYRFGAFFVCFFHSSLFNISYFIPNYHNEVTIIELKKNIINLISYYFKNDKNLWCNE